MRRLTVSLLGLIGCLFCFTASSFAQHGTATFLGTDTTTLGNWQGTYGTVGLYIPSGPSSTPSDGSTFNPGAASLWTWGTNVASTSALKTSGGNIASAWYNNLGTSAPSLTLDVIVPSGSQTVALYLLDYDQQGRSESVSVTDASNNPLDGPHAVNNFMNGEYLTWTVSGEVHINITLVNGPNAVASGIFFGENSSMPPPVTASAYTTHKVVVVANNATDQSTKVILPAGTYFIRADINALMVGEPTPLSLQIFCSIQLHDPTSASASLTEQGILSLPTESGEGAFSANASLSMSTPITLTTPDTLYLTCQNGGFQTQIDVRFTALTEQTINTQ